MKGIHLIISLLLFLVRTTFLAAFTSRLGNSVTGFKISDESGNRFFPTAVKDYWQDKAACRHEDQWKRH